MALQPPRYSLNGFEGVFLLVDYVDRAGYEPRKQEYAEQLGQYREDIQCPPLLGVVELRDQGPDRS